MRLSGRLTPDAADVLVDDVLTITLAGLGTGIALASDARASENPSDQPTEYRDGEPLHAQSQN